MTAQQVTAHPASVEAYIRHGWGLVPIPPASKAPQHEGWNRVENTLKPHHQLPQGWGIGLAHAYSGTMALDIDDWATASTMLSFAGIDLHALYEAPDAVIIDSGRAGRGKLLYKMPDGVRMTTKRIAYEGRTIYEMRCATASGMTVQDVLPPSIHPDTKQPYRWAGNGHWSRLPEIPQALMQLWKDLSVSDTKRTLSAVDAISVSWSEVQSAVDAISPDCSHDEWVSVGMALHYAGQMSGRSDEALAIWNGWSQHSAKKYAGEAAIVKRWGSFSSDKSHGIRLGTLFHLAKQYGWTRPPLDASQFFSAVDNIGGVGKKSNVVATLSMRPPPPKCDLDLFPPVLSRRAREIADSIGLDALVPLWAGMCAVAGAIDARSRLKITHGFEVPPVLWAMTIGNPAAKKSPGSKPMFQILRELEKSDLPNFAKRKLEYQLLDAQYQAALTAAEKYVASPDGVMDGINGDGVPVVPPEPQEPQPLTIVVEDITSQKLVQTAGYNQRGLLCVMDEMSTWVTKMSDGRQVSTEDKGNWTKSYEAGNHRVSRMSSGSTYIENYAVSIYGNIQPQVLADTHRGLAKDGMLQRFIPVLLDERENKVGTPIPDFLTNIQEYDQMVRAVFSLPALTYELDDDAYAEFREFQHWYEQVRQDEMLLQASTPYLTALGKSEGLLGRLIFLIHVCENPFIVKVGRDVVARCARLMREYIIPTMRYVHNGDLGGASDLELWVSDYLVTHGAEFEAGMVTLSDIKRSARRQLENIQHWQADRVVINAMDELQRKKWVYRIDDGSKESKGFAQWAVNPEITNLFANRADQIAQARKRRSVTME